MTTQVKVTIPRDVANMIEALRSDDHYGPARDNAYICELAMRTGGGVPIATSTLRKIPFDTLMRALLDGYDVELTEEEKREKAYATIRECLAYNGGSEYERGFDDGMLVVLRKLGIAIPGVNAPEETTHKEEPAHV